MRVKSSGKIEFRAAEDLVRIDRFGVAALASRVDYVQFSQRHRPVLIGQRLRVLLSCRITITN